MSAESESVKNNLHFVTNILNNKNNKYNLIMVMDNNSVTSTETNISQNMNYIAKYLGISDFKYMNILVVYLGSAISKYNSSLNFNIYGNAPDAQISSSGVVSETNYTVAYNIMNQYNNPSQATLNTIHNIVANPNPTTDYIQIINSKNIIPPACAGRPLFLISFISPFLLPSFSIITP